MPVVECFESEVNFESHNESANPSFQFSLSPPTSFNPKGVAFHRGHMAKREKAKKSTGRDRLFFVSSALQALVSARRASRAT